MLGDTSTRDYSRKLKLFNSFAARELQHAVAWLQLQPGMCVLDAGCGSGDVLKWLFERTHPGGSVVGMDLAAPHTAAARELAGPEMLVVQGNLIHAPLKSGQFDAIWCANTINHVREPVDAIKALSSVLKSEGRIALGQSSFLPDMYLAWDARLERLTTDAIRQYYRDKYNIDERATSAARSLVGLLLRAELRNISVKTFVIERISPLDPPDVAYLQDTVFNSTWSKRLQAYLSKDDHDELMHLCDPADPLHALLRPDFHFLQTFTVAVGCL